MKDFEKSKEDLTLAQKLEPTNNEVSKTLKIVTDQLKAQMDKEKQIYKKMFS